MKDKIYVIEEELYYDDEVKTQFERFQTFGEPKNIPWVLYYRIQI